MSKSALHEVTSLDSLKNAWETTRSSVPNHRRGSGHPSDLTINEFSAHEDEFLRSVQRKLRLRQFKFSPLRASILPKPNGGNRIICVPKLVDRIVQRSILNYLNEGDKCQIINSVSFGFIPGRGVKKAASRACELRRKHPWVYKTDIAKFFDTIDRELLKEKVRLTIKNHSLHDLIYQIIDCELHDEVASRRKKIRSAGIVEGKGIRQGMPISPLLSNLILREFDYAVDRQGIHMVRYADDLIVAADSEKECREIHEFCRDRLLKIGLNIPEPDGKPATKSQIYRPEEPAEFLGVGIVAEKKKSKYKLTVLENQKRKILQQVQDSFDFAELSRRKVTIAKLVQRCDGIIAGYSSAYEYCSNVEQLEIAIKHAIRDSLRRLFEVELGINLKELSEVQRAFLGL